MATTITTTMATTFGNNKSPIQFHLQPGRQWGNEAFPAFSHVQNLRLWHFFSRSQEVVLNFCFTHTESQTHTYCYTPIKTYEYRRRLTLFSFVWHLIHFDLFVLWENSLSAIEFARVETSDWHTDSHTRLHCAFIACVHRRRRTETETYFWALHLSASQPTFQTSLSLLHYQDEASCVVVVVVVVSRLSLLLLLLLLLLSSSCAIASVKAIRGRSRLPNCCWIRRILSRSHRSNLTDSLNSRSLWASSMETVLDLDLNYLTISTIYSVSWVMMKGVLRSYKTKINK